jgi:hypothetical protein
MNEKIREYWRSFNNWFFKTPERAILEAYAAAKAIQKMEIEQFGGQKIAPESANYSENVMAFWQGNLTRNLAIIKVRLAEFKLGISLVNTADSTFLEKLKFIDEITSKYDNSDPEYKIFTEPENQDIPTNDNNLYLENIENIENKKEPSATEKTGVFPRSIGRTFNKIAKDFTPTAEEEFVKSYRTSRNKTRKAIKFLLILIIVPLLTQHFSKEILIKPLLENFVGENNTRIFINSEMEEKAFNELKMFEKKLQFKTWLRQAPELSAENIEAQVKNKALEIAEEFRYKSSSAISNVFADVISLIAFAIIIVLNKKNIVFLQSLLDKIVYGLSDSAKAFLIILVTDIFVGFHSPHGWEVLLEGLANHLGLPASRNAIFLFIATFPVILNTIFKYWIFRYLSRLSPSALATLKEMDE